MTAKKATLEKIHAGITKKIVTISKEGERAILSTSIQGVLKIDGEKMVILSKEKLQPQNTAACRTAGYATSSESRILIYEKVPSLQKTLGALDASAIDSKSEESECVEGKYSDILNEPTPTRWCRVASM